MWNCGCHRGRCTRPWPPPSPAASICLREAPLWVFSRVAALHAVVMHAEPPNDGFCVFSGVLHFAVQDNFCRPRHWPSSLTMFYTQQLRARKGPLGLWWLLGNGRPLSGVQCRCSTAELQHIAGMRQSMPASHTHAQPTCPMLTMHALRRRVPQDQVDVQGDSGGGRRADQPTVRRTTHCQAPFAAHLH